MAASAKRLRVRRALRAGLALALIACTHAYRGPVSDHFDGTQFHSAEPVNHTFGEWFKRETTRHRGPWRSFTDTRPGPRPPERIADDRMRVTFINHSTVLLQMDGVNVLTDPTWAPRSIPWVGSRRRRPPGLCFEDLPPIDAVLVSHDHHDHMDLPTLRRLAGAFHPTMFVGLGNAAYLTCQGVPGARDLDWWQSAEIAPGVRVTAVPSRHHSGRGPFDADRTLWCGFVVTGPAGSAYFAGDTGFGSHFESIRSRFPKLRVALLPIGGFTPVWYMHQIHMSPRDAVEAARVLGAGTVVPVHFGTFPGSDDAEFEPLESLHVALAESPDIASRFVVLDNGQSLEVGGVRGEGSGARDRGPE